MTPQSGTRRDSFHSREAARSLAVFAQYSPEVYRVSDSPVRSDSQFAISEMQTLMTQLTCALVDDVAAVRVEVFTDQDATVLRLHVAPGDIGKVIGKQGRTARSLRTILGAASMKLQRRFSLDIVEANRSHTEHNEHPGHDDQ